MRKSILVGVVLLLGLAACASASLTAAQLGLRQAHRELVLLTAAVDTAYGAMQTPGLSPAVLADIKAGVAVVSGGVQSQVTVLQQGGSLTSEGVAALAGGVQSGIPKLGAILHSAHGSSATAKEVALESGEGAFSALPDVVVLLSEDIDPGFVPTVDQIKSDATNLQAALDKVQAYGQ